MRAMLAALAALVLAGGAGPRVHVAPIVVDIPAGARIAAFNVSNTGAAPLAFTLTPFDWMQEGGVNRLTPSTGLRVTPPAFVVPPGARQIVRVGLVDPAPKEMERAFRLILSETPLEADAAPGALRMRLEMSLPVFAAPAKKSSAAPIFAAEGGMLRIDNPGNRRLQIAPAERAVGAPPYVLAGAWMARPLSAGETDDLRLIIAEGSDGAPAPHALVRDPARMR